MQPVIAQQFMVYPREGSRISGCFPLFVRGYSRGRVLAMNLPPKLLGSTPAPGVANRALAASGERAVLARTYEPFRCVRVFREGAENRARGRARSPEPQNRRSFINPLPKSGSWVQYAKLFGGNDSFHPRRGKLLAPIPRFGVFILCQLEDQPRRASFLNSRSKSGTLLSAH